MQYSTCRLTRFPHACTLTSIHSSIPNPLSLPLCLPHPPHRYDQLKARQSSALLGDSDALVAQWRALQTDADQRNAHVHVRTVELEAEAAHLRQQLDASRADVAALQHAQIGAAQALTDAQKARAQAAGAAAKAGKAAAADAARVAQLQSKDAQWKALHAADKAKLAERDATIAQHELVIRAYQMMTATRILPAAASAAASADASEEERAKLANTVQCKCVNRAEGRVLEFALDLGGDAEIKYAPTRVQVAAHLADALSKECVSFCVRVFVCAWNQCSRGRVQC
jgi:hypothetical protein